ncbi:hypothetical protein GCM10009846_22680 [Agrococcus versicolor]|uniref:Resolvase/invertase-type recombinase catalytic domain-containing protein n=1 Tax=Agrococcus versicolor TaxID=501482 RepID=A0ABP5MLH6_9MICO
MPGVPKRCIETHFHRNAAPPVFGTFWAHPLREGNGRTTILFLHDVAQHSRSRLDFGRVDPDTWNARADVSRPRDVLSGTTYPHEIAPLFEAIATRRTTGEQSDDVAIEGLIARLIASTTPSPGTRHYRPVVGRRRPHVATATGQDVRPEEWSGDDHRLRVRLDARPEPRLACAELEAADCTRVYVDHGESSRHAQRPQWLACLDRLEPVDVLVFRALDRIAGTERMAIDTLMQLKDRPVEVSAASRSQRSIRPPRPTRSSGRSRPHSRSCASTPSVRTPAAALAMRAPRAASAAGPRS